MAEETKSGAPFPTGPNQAHSSPLTCAEFDALLSDALDGESRGSELTGAVPAGTILTGTTKNRFDAHRRVCAVCGPLFADAEAGRLWLRGLEAVEPPPLLVNNILMATTGIASSRLEAASKTPFSERAREWWDSWLTPVTAFIRQPRFVMSFGMIFFTFSLVLSTAGVKASDVAKIDLRPSALRHAYNDTQIKFVQYYDNIRFVYEIESKVRELKRATTPAEPGPQPKKEKRSNDNTSGQPEQRQDRMYSLDDQGRVVLARLDLGHVNLGHVNLGHAANARKHKELLLAEFSSSEFSRFSNSSRLQSAPTYAARTTSRLVMSQLVKARSSRHLACSYRRYL
jgi:hypothetical protein